MAERIKVLVKGREKQMDKRLADLLVKKNKASLQYDTRMLTAKDTIKKESKKTSRRKKDKKDGDLAV